MTTGQKIARLLDRARRHPHQVARLFRALAQVPAALPLEESLLRRLCDALKPDGESPAQQLLSGLSSGPPVVRWNVIRLLLDCPDKPARLGSRLFLAALADPVPAVRQCALEALVEAEWPIGCPESGVRVICHQALVAPDEPMRQAGIRLATRFGVWGVRLDLQRLADSDPSPAVRLMAGQGLLLLGGDQALLVTGWYAGNRHSAA